MNRCQYRAESGEQCRLPVEHQCDHELAGEPLSLAQSLAWRQEGRMAREAERAAIVAYLCARIEALRERDPYGAWALADAKRAIEAVYHQHGDFVIRDSDYHNPDTCPRCRKEGV